MCQKLFIWFLIEKIEYGCMNNNRQHYLAILGRLHIIGNRLIQTNLVHDVRVQQTIRMSNIIIENERQASEMDKEFNSFIIIGNCLLDRIIINLYNLIEAHNELLPHLIDNGLGSLEEALSDAWCEIENNKELVRKLRNLIVAHGQLFGKNDLTVFGDLGQSQTCLVKTLYKMSHCAGIYVQGIINNVPEHTDAFHLLQNKIKNEPPPQPQDYLNSKIDAGKILQQTQKKLTVGNFKANLTLDVHFE